MTINAHSAKTALVVHRLMHSECLVQWS